MDDYTVEDHFLLLNLIVEDDSLISRTGKRSQRGSEKAINTNHLRFPGQLAPKTYVLK